jgi:hypothetical protein
MAQISREVVAQPGIELLIGLPSDADGVGNDFVSIQMPVVLKKRLNSIEDKANVNKARTAVAKA